MLESNRCDLPDLQRMLPAGAAALILLVVVALMAPASATASEGVVELNQTCAVQTGCSADDEAGFPIKLAVAGSYRLTSNLVVPDVNTNAIEVHVGAVSIDLAGFEITRAGCSGSLSSCRPATETGSGIDGFQPGARGVSVRDGTITGMGDVGVFLGEQSEVRNVRARWNRVAGISVQDGSVIEGCSSEENGAGIFARFGSTVSRNTARLNEADGFFVIESTLANNSAISNGEDGFELPLGPSAVTGNLAFGNQDDGIDCPLACVISDNVAARNDGVGIKGGGTIHGNASRENDLDGIEALTGASVSSNVASGNLGFGLDLSSGSSYRENTISGNTLGTVTGTGFVNAGGNVCNAALSCP